MRHTQWLCLLCHDDVSLGRIVRHKWYTTGPYHHDTGIGGGREDHDTRTHAHNKKVYAMSSPAQLIYLVLCTAAFCQDKVLLQRAIREIAGGS